MRKVFKSIRIHPSLPLISLAVFISCFTGGVSSLGIIGGHPTEQPYPFFVVVLAEGHICGGTLVSWNAVLTAAHCLFNKRRRLWTPIKDVSVIKADFRDTLWIRKSKIYSVERYVTHKDYSPYRTNGLVPFDIAIVKLRNRIPIDNPVNGGQLLQPCPMSTNYAQGYVIGFGLTQMKPPLGALVLMGTRLRRYTPCQALVFSTTLNLKAQVCYGTPRKDRFSGTCRGDSGGPLFYRNSTTGDAVCLIGVDSFTSLYCDRPDIPTVFTKAAFFAEWIKQTIATFN